MKPAFAQPFQVSAVSLFGGRLRDEVLSGLSSRLGVDEIGPFAGAWHGARRAAPGCQPPPILDIVGRSRVVLLTERRAPEPGMQHEEREPQPQGRVAGGKEAADVVAHKVAGEPVGEDSLEGWPHLDPQLLALDVVGKEDASAVQVAPDPEGSGLLYGELLQRSARDAVDEEEADISPGLVVKLAQIGLELRHFAALQYSGAVVNAAGDPKSEGPRDQPKRHEEQRAENTSDEPAARERSFHSLLPG